MNKKAIVVLIVSLILASAKLTEAQQPAKVPRIGYVLGTGNPANPGPTLKHCGKDCEISVRLTVENIVIEYRGAEGKVLMRATKVIK